MPSIKRLFEPEVEREIRGFLETYEIYIRELINSAEDPANRHHYQKLKNYIHNIILRRAELETTVNCFGSRVIGTSTRISDLDIFVHAGES